MLENANPGSALTLPQNSNRGLQLPSLVDTRFFHRLSDLLLY